MQCLALTPSYYYVTDIFDIFLWQVEIVLIIGKLLFENE